MPTALPTSPPPSAPASPCTDAAILLERLQALAEPTRLQIVEQLARGECCVCDLQGALDAAQSRLSFHLKKLKEAGILEDRREGRWAYYSLVPGALDEVVEGLSSLRRGRGGDIRDKGDTVDIGEVVREKYGDAARAVQEKGARASCCGSGSGSGDGSGGGCGTATPDPITEGLYDEATRDALPEGAVLASLGCGNPTLLADLKEGEVVLDLGSGGGIDVLLSARRVGPTGKAFGVDTTPEMLALARANAAAAGVSNVQFLEGEIEALPLPDASVDVIISNCVVNLSADKGKVIREAFRVLRPGGRFAVSDVVARGELPEDLRRSLELWVGCVAGALEDSTFLALLHDAGFVDASIEPTREYAIEDARAFLAEGGLDVDALEGRVDGALFAGFVRARKPV